MAGREIVPLIHVREKCKDAESDLHHFGFCLKLIHSYFVFYVTSAIWSKEVSDGFTAEISKLIFKDELVNVL
jgi:hypothetical protein